MFCLIFSIIIGIVIQTRASKDSTFLLTRRRRGEDNSAHAQAASLEEINFCPSRRAWFWELGPASLSHRVKGPHDKSLLSVLRIREFNVSRDDRVYTLGLFPFSVVAEILKTLPSQLERTREHEKKSGETYFSDCRAQSEIIITLFLRRGDRYWPWKRWILLAVAQF